MVWSLNSCGIFWAVACLKMGHHSNENIMKHQVCVTLSEKSLKQWVDSLPLAARKWRSGSTRQSGWSRCWAWPTCVITWPTCVIRSLHVSLGEDEVHPSVNAHRNRKPIDLIGFASLRHFTRKFLDNLSLYWGKWWFPIKIWRVSPKTSDKNHMHRGKHTSLAGVEPEADAAKAAGLALGTG